MTKVLLIESDIKTLLSMNLMLVYKGFKVTSCASVEKARNSLAKNHYQIIIAGIHHQRENMFEFTKSLRMSGVYVPVVYLAERAYQEEVTMKMSGLDECIMKPFNFSHLMEIMRNAISKSSSNQKPLLYGGITLCETKKVLSVNDKIIHLGKMEMKILMLLAKKAGRIVTLDHLYSLYDMDTNFNTRVFSYVSNIRKKLEDAGVHGLKINFVRDGYKLEVI